MAGGSAHLPGRFDLVTVDLDGTLLPEETAFAAVLRQNGFEHEVVGSDLRFFAGRQSLQETFEEQWQCVQTLDLAAMHRALRKAHWLDGIAEGVARLKDAGLRVALLTDQPCVLADYAARWGVDPAICSPCQTSEGRVVDLEVRFDKLANLDRRLAEWGLGRDRVCHVGNGTNDVPVFRAVGGSIAVFAEPDVAAAADLDLGRPESFDEVAATLLGAPPP